MQQFDDPGWRFGKNSPNSGNPDGLLVLRIVFLSLVTAALSILFILIFRAPKVGQVELPLGAVVVALGLYGIAAARWTSRRPLVIDSADTLVGMAAVAPTKRNLDRRQQQIQAQGTGLSLARSLSESANAPRA